ncbi:MAG: pantetheine-phosphate adenylyltransferase [Planctomycetota bacterium]|jgi:pantetheine-phosphate adenylyltransferase
MSATHALFPGSFDPITLGHVDLIRRAAAIFSRVTVLVASHASKQQLLSLPQRLELISAALAGIEGVQVAGTSGLLVDACKEFDASVVIRGVRGATDLEYEVQMANTNRAMRPTMDTLFLAPAPEHAHVSSTLVRQIATMGGDVSGFVPLCVSEALQAHFKSK